ncbi:MAG: alpha/beta hydrolase [Clostridia bacterium]|nr:alpha/beta hydrolase [Clostridia bacterium]
MQPYVIAIIVIGAVICLTFALAVLTYCAAFGKRCDRNPLLKYFTAEDFGLAAEEFSLGKLKGAIYKSESADKRDGVVVFVHGMGPGHCAYMTEIAYFCGLGYTVVAADSLGCGASKGRSIRGMYEGVKSAVKTVDFAKKQFAGEKIYLAGHSWGAYSALCASAEIKVDKVAAISAPSTPVKTLREGAARFISKPLAYILSPFWYIINFLVFGTKGNKSAVKCARINGTRTLLIHGGKDGIVTPVKAAYYGVYGENVTKFFDENKAHNPYNTVSAEAKLAELNAALFRARKMTEEERKEYFGNFDYKGATEEDVAVMGVIKEFLED